MSELVNDTADSQKIRLQLLATVSALSLMSAACLSSAQAQSDGDRPTVWIELGGQLERNQSGQELFAPNFTNQFQSDNFLPLGDVEHLPRYSNGFEGALSFQPKRSDWTFSAAIRYGRSNVDKASYNQTNDPAPLHVTISVPALGVDINQTGLPKSRRLATAAAHTDESHGVLDFQAGHDVGLGLFGGSSTVDLGIRIAQFASKSTVRITADPGGVVPAKYATTFAGYSAYINWAQSQKEQWNIYHATASISRTFRGAGPSLSFIGSIPVVGNLRSLRANLDFGINGSILFGRQKAVIHEKIYDDRPISSHPYNIIPMTTVYHHHYNRVRSRTAIVPNIGGFAGLSFNYSNAKIKLGYRADFFFGAMDGGIDTRKTYDRNFYGPFATISIGLGG